MRIYSALLALGATLANAVPSLEVVDNYFVNPATNTRFQIVGVAYQPGGSSAYGTQAGVDPLSDKDICLRDAAILQVLGANAIRVYNLNPDLSHDECASIFNAAGIYMLLDVNSPLPGESLTSVEPYKSYYAAYLNRTFAVVEAFKEYPNTLAFFSGNEVMDDETTSTWVPPYMRAVTRDIKNYVAAHSKRPIPVGYSAADVRNILFDTWNYFQCVENGDQKDTSKVDLFALNSYSWCGNSSFTESGYNVLVEGFTGSSVPVFYSEFGCNNPAPRNFSEVPAIYGSQMTGVFSGGIVYEYTQGVNEFGLVNISSDGSVVLTSDFHSLKAQYAKLNFTQIQSTPAPKPGSGPKAPACNPKLITDDMFSTNFTLPVLPPGAKEIIQGGVSQAPSGKIVKISDYSVKHTVANADGSVLVKLAVKPLPDNAFNIPGSNEAVSTAAPSPTTTAAAGTTSAPAPTQSKDAGSKPVAVVLPAVAMGAFAVLAGIAI
ncbi:Glucanosyltransferase-domain-containing protein [Lasiosphaeria ovina]|uniref:1,3-beta-glucanosyltransferase n=1 Tax=Lasiosphaeria ovina TaxID=92902 RepID=A0AAE0K6Y0_9PEZI|nr:Glucanosyltransferase-domain-containing protein [Lasiosphaeria ovina]